MNVLSLFDGLSCGQIALKELGIMPDKYYASEIDKHAIAQTQLNFPNTIQLGSVVDVDVSKLEPIQLLLGGSPCFAAGTKVLTIDGYKNIEDIVVGDMVLTHKNRFMPVLRVGGKVENTFTLKAQGFIDVVCTENHPFYARKKMFEYYKKSNGNKSRRMFLGEPEWVEAGDLKDDYYVCSNIQNGKCENNLDITEDEAYIIDKPKIIDDKIWHPVKSFTINKKQVVYNLEVAEDNSYTANNFVVHNCQNFSFAGKRNGMTTTENEEIYTLDRYLQLKEEGFQFEGQSYLFWEFMRILTDIRKYNPGVKFLLENVEMGDKWERVLSEAIGVFGVHINSALVSAQQRKRIYFTNIRVKQVGLFGELHSDIPQPKDEGILLKDILEKEVEEKYYLSDKLISSFENNTKKMKEKGNGFSFKPTDGNKKGNAVTTKCGSRMDDDFICVAQRGRNPDNPSDRKTGSPTKQRLEPNYSGKTNTLTTVQKDNLILQIKEATSKGYTEINPGECFDFENPNSKTRRGRKMDAKCNSLMSQNMSFMHYTENYRIRRLTPTEAARLQTIPEWYVWKCSSTQQYKLLGNGWNIETIKHIFKFMK